MEHTPLGRQTGYADGYDASVLAPVARSMTRSDMGIDSASLPFVGEDVWTGYELSWLSRSGLPRVGALRLRVGADSPNLIESKSLKLYLNGLAQTRFDGAGEVAGVLAHDLSRAAGAMVSADVLTLDELDAGSGTLPGESLDTMDISADVYERDPVLLAIDQRAHDGGDVEETLHTHLFRSLCPVTGQPDWASILVRYQGPRLDRESLLRYLVSFRCHRALHETTVEQIFVDLKTRCRCRRLLVGGYFLRRGGLDINPFRADPGEGWPVIRLSRQ